MKTHQFLFLIIAMILGSSAYAASTCNTPTTTLPSLDSVYKSGKFRIYYSTNPNNVDYIPDQTDVNANGIPDYVENLAIQANATTDALTYLGFTHPLESDRYKNVAHYIDIHLLAIDGNGIAYEIPGNWVNKPSKEGKCALLLVVRNNLESFPGNYWTTGTHEIFHLYQYGYNQFKGGWYLEGMTNLMERVLKLGTQGGSGLTPLPSTQIALDSDVYNVPYNQLWHRLAVLSDSTSGQLNLPSSLLNRTYLDGTKVFKDEKLKGHAFVKQVLDNMKTTTDQLSVMRGWDAHNWAELDQTTPANRPHMLKAIQDAMYQFGMNKTNEEKEFLKLQ